MSKDKELTQFANLYQQLHFRRIHYEVCFKECFVVVL